MEIGILGSRIVGQTLADGFLEYGHDVMCGSRDPQKLTGKTVIDAINPISDAPPTHDVLNFFTDMNESLMERAQRKAPGANFVKAFS